MEIKERVQASWPVLLSFAHKALYVIIAVLGFRSLQWLGDRKAEVDDYRRGRWVVDDKVNLATTEAVRATFKGLPLPPASEGSPVDACLDRAAEDGDLLFGSREELIAAMQERTDVCIASRFVEMTADASQDLGLAYRRAVEREQAESEQGQSGEVEKKESEKGRDKREKVDKLERSAEFIRKADAYALITTRVARQKVATKLRGMSLTQRQFDKCDEMGALQRAKGSFVAAGAVKGKNEKTSPELYCYAEVPSNKADLARWVRSLAPETSESHVVYEMLWYAALLLGVVSSSLLFLVFLTSLPLTSAEGYWTKRIGQFLERVPIPSKTAAAIPLLTAVLGAGTLAGAIVATEPGGQSHQEQALESCVACPLTHDIDSEGNSPIVSTEGPAGPAGKNGETGPAGPGGSPGLWPLPFYRPDGVRYPTIYNTSYDSLFGPELAQILPAGSVVVDLSTLEAQARSVAEDAAKSREAIAGIPEQLQGELNRVATAAQAVQGLAALVEASALRLEKSVGDGSQALADVRIATQSIKQTLEKSQENLVEQAGLVRERVDEEAGYAKLALAQSAELDERGFWERSFRSTHYQVGPLVPQLVLTWLDEKDAALEKEMIGKQMQAGDINKFRKMRREARQTIRQKLEVLREAPAQSRRKFEDHVRESLKGADLPYSLTDLLLKENRRSFLNACALSRL